jgi:hypothetical protein
MTAGPEEPLLDVERILDTLERHHLKYLVLGGTAANAYGAQRITKDFDCLPERSLDNLARLAGAMRELNARLRVAGLTDAEAQRLPVHVDAHQLRQVEPSTWRTDAGDFDVLADLPDRRGRHLGYEDLTGRAVTDLGGLSVRVAALDDVIASSRAGSAGWGRPGGATWPTTWLRSNERLGDDARLARLRAARPPQSSQEAGEAPYAEGYQVPVATAALVNAARHANRRVLAVGTTVTRALESAAGPDGSVRPAQGWTELVISPDRGVRVVDALLTGWHEPRASHLALLEAVAGRALLERSYAAALAGVYRWHEFGDLHLVLP